MSLIDSLKAIPLFKNLHDADLRLVAANLRRESYPKGAILFTEGDSGNTMFLVESGQLAVINQKTGENLAAIGPGNFVGDISLLLTQPRTATVQVTIDAQLWSLSRKKFDDLIDARPSIALEMMRELSRRLITTTRRRLVTTTRRITALAGSHRGVELSEAIHFHLKSPVALLTLPSAQPINQSQLSSGVMFLDNHNLTESGLAESLSHQVEVYKHIVLVLPNSPDDLALKAIDLADTVVSIGPPPAWLSSGLNTPDLWITPDSETDVYRTARRLTNRIVGLALSSGGTRGLAHIGVLKVLQQEKIPSDMIAGSSAGALFGGLFAAGLSIDEICRYVKDLKNLTHISNWDFNLPPKTGLVKGRRARDKFLARPLHNATFNQMKIPLYIIASDILTGEEVIMAEGSVADAIRASASIPILGDPWFHQHHYLIDGGVVNPLPASVLRDHGANIIIASNVIQPLKETYNGPLDQAPGIGQVIFHMISAMEVEMLKKQLPLVDVLIHHSVSARHSLDFTHADEIIRLGEEAANQMLPAIRQLLQAPIES